MKKTEIEATEEEDFMEEYELEKKVNNLADAEQYIILRVEHARMDRDNIYEQMAQLKENVNDLFTVMRHRTLTKIFHEADWMICEGIPAEINTTTETMRDVLEKMIGDYLLRKAEKALRRRLY